MIRSLCLSIALLLGCLSAFAQTDSLKTEIHDVLALEKGGLIRGEILSFDAIGGGIVFEDLNGKIYSLAREEYQYFKEDQVFEIKQKGPKVLHPRKESGWEIQLGISAAYLAMVHDFTADVYYLNGVESLADLPVALKVAAGTYLNPSNYLGFTAEFALATETAPNYQAGLRYKHFYDAGTTNLGLYIPVELTYQHLNITSNFAVNDTVFTGGGFTFPDDQDLTTTVNAASISLGQGFAFMLANEKSVAIELTLLAHLQLSQEFQDLDRESPMSQFGTRGVKLSVMFGL